MKNKEMVEAGLFGFLLSTLFTALISHLIKIDVTASVFIFMVSGTILSCLAIAFLKQK